LTAIGHEQILDPVSLFINFFGFVFHMAENSVSVMQIRACGFFIL
jgi:hypothetical protein